VVANTGVGDLDALIAPDRNGSAIVADFEDETLREALQQVLAVSDERRGTIRANSTDMSLEEGVRRYAAIYDALERP
jgi:hypothetical protein